MKLQNVILLGIDSLRADRTSMGGYEYNTSPSLEKMARRGIYCSDAITHSGPTQFALPSVFTSTLPLDFGGYDEGITSRPISLPEIFKQYGFKTVGFNMDCWSSSLGGYDRGFDESINLFDVAGVWRNSALYFDYYEKIKEGGFIDQKEFIRLVTDYLFKIMKFTISYCHDEQRNIEAYDGKYNDIYQYDFEQIGSTIADELVQMEQDPEGYIGRHFDNIANLDYFIRKNNRQAYKVGALWFMEKMTFKKIRASRIKYFLYKHFVSGEYLINRSIKWIENNKKSPFFLWLFINDVHESNCSTGRGKVYHQGINGYLKSIGRPDKYFPWYAFNKDSIQKRGVRYDASIRYADNNIAKLVSYLNDTSLMKNTLLVIFADHGVGLGINHRQANLTASLCEEYIRVPLIFFNPDIGAKMVNWQCGLIDIGPTVMDLIGLKSIPDFKGLPAHSLAAKERDHLIIENVHRGPCDIARKPINIAVRTKKWKYMFVEQHFQQDLDTPLKKSLYDLETDPGENNDLAGDATHSEIEKKLHKIAQERCKEIRNSLVK